jgi:hypothetical protein
MKYNKDLINKLENLCSEFDHLLQEGVVLSSFEKEKMLKIIKDIESIVDNFDVS